MPPSQAGRFKPRKPIRKAPVRSAGASTNEQTPSTTGTAIQTPATMEVASRAPVAGRGRGRGGRGRGRGSRAPAPQGQAFFTGVAPSNAPPASTRNAAIASATAPRVSVSTLLKRRTEQRKRAAQAASNEEVVGTMEEGVGAQFANTMVDDKPEEVGSSNNADGSRDDTATANSILVDSKSRGGTGSSGTAARSSNSDGPFVSGYTYDSDSSEDADGSPTKKAIPSRYLRHQPTIKPLVLPFPTPASTTAASRLSVTSTSDPVAEPVTSAPAFGSEEDVNKDSWFLVQLPTRLPPLHRRLIPDRQASSGDIVATPAAKEGAFDNTLTETQAGRLGKIKIHESGKMVLELEGVGGHPVVCTCWKLGCVLNGNLLTLLWFPSLDSTRCIRRPFMRVSARGCSLRYN